MRISDWSSDVCSSDLSDCKSPSTDAPRAHCALIGVAGSLEAMLEPFALTDLGGFELAPRTVEFGLLLRERGTFLLMPPLGVRSEEHTSELQSLLRISFADFVVTQKKKRTNNTT